MQAISQRPGFVTTVNFLGQRQLLFSPKHKCFGRKLLSRLRGGVIHLANHPVIVGMHIDAQLDQVRAAGFDPTRPAVIASTGVSMYLTREANEATLREIATLAPGSTFVMTFLCPLEMADPAVRPGLQRAADGATASGTPFVSYFRPDDVVAMAQRAGFKRAEHVSAAMLTERYFAGRADGLCPPTNAEELLVAST